MASNRYSQTIAEIQSSPIAGCVQPAAPYHHHATSTLLKWRALERLGFVRLTSEVDVDYNPRDFDEPADSEAFGSIGEYAVPGDSAWCQADSVWGHVGYRDVLDWRENAYILDIMSTTIDAFRDAWKVYVRKLRETRAGICPCCHGTGKS